MKNMKFKAKLTKRVKKHRKIKNKKKQKFLKEERSNKLSPYWALLVALKKSTKRPNGEYVKFDWNRMLTFTEPKGYGPSAKTDNEIPNFMGTFVKGPVCMELVKTKIKRMRFESVIKISGGIV